MTNQSLIEEPTDDPLLVAQGKTKKIVALEKNPYMGKFTALDVVTWGNEHVLPLEHKGEWSTHVTCNLFKFLSRKGIEVAYLGRLST